MALPEIRIILTASADGVKSGIRVATNALDQLENRTDRVAGALSGLGTRLTSFGARMTIASAAISAGAAATLVLVKNAADAGDKIANASRKVGVSAEYYQEMAFAVGQVADVTEDEFGNALTILNRKLGEAQQGSKSAIAAFEAVGVSAADIAAGTVTTEVAFDAFIAKLGQVEDPALAAAIATDLLGKQGARMGGLLAGASGEVTSLRDRAQELGIVMSDEVVDASEKFGDRMEELQRSFDGVKVKIAEALLPVLVDKLIPALTDHVIPAIGQVVAKIGEWVQWFQQLPGPVQEAASVIAVALGVGGPVLTAVGAVSMALGALVAATGPVGLFIAAAATAAAVWTTWGDDIKTAVGGAIDWIGVKFDAFMEKLQGIINKAVALKTAIVEAFQPGSLDPMGEAPTVMQDPNPQAGWMTDMYGQGVLTGQGLANGIADGLHEGLTIRTPDIQSTLQGVTDTANQTFEINSPSRVFHGIGGYISEGLANGILDGMALVNGAIGALSGSAIEQTGQMTDGILQGMNTLFAGNKRIAAAIAFVSTMQGAAKEMEKGVFGFASAAAVIAKGMAFVSAIKSSSPAGGGAAAAGGAGSGAASARPAVQVTPPQPLQVRLSGFDPGSLYSGAVIGGLLDSLSKEAGDRGMKLMWSA